MTFTATILRNIKLLTAAQIVASAAGLFSSALLARALGTDGFGVLGFGTAFLSLLGIAASLSTDMYGTREIARDRAKAGLIAGSIIGLRLILSIFVFSVFIAIVSLLDRSTTEKIVLLVQAGGIFVSIFVLDFVFQGLERMGINGLRQVSVALVTLAAVLLLVRTPDDLLMAAGIPVVAGVLAVSLIWIYARRNLADLSPTFSPSRWRRILAASLPMAVSGVMQTIIFNTDAVMLGFMTDNVQTGLYVSAFKIVGLTMIPVGLLTAPFFPGLSAGWDDRKMRHDRSKTFATSVLILSLPLVIFIALFPELILRVLFGEAFSAAAPALLILMASMLMMHLRIIYGNPLIAWNDERFIMVATLVGAVLNVVLNLVLIPDFGIIGAAYASLASQSVIVLGIAFKFRLKTATLHGAVLWRAGLCIGVAATAVWFSAVSFGSGFSANILTLVVNGVIFGVIYLVALVLVFKPDLRQIFYPLK